jgi:hypothetical protein
MSGGGGGEEYEGVNEGAFILGNNEPSHELRLKNSKNKNRDADSTFQTVTRTLRFNC